MSSAMADGDGRQQALRYSAFISYSHTDSAFARRLHRKLESYRLPRRLAEQRGESGPAARRLRPIFRDREELPAAADLTQAVRSALGESSYLIVICSPHSSTSAWVAREIELFRDLHGDGGILAALVDGATDDAFRCLFGGTKDGGQSPEPLAADFRRDGDGGRLAYLKLVAALAGVRLDALIQRDAQRRVRQATAVGASALLGMTAMGVLALIAINARNAAQQERARGEALIDYLLTDMRGRLKAVGRLDLLDGINAGATAYYRSQDLSQLSSDALLQRAKLLQAIGQDYESRGNDSGALVVFEEAERTTGSLLLQSPNDQKRIFAHSQSEFWIGEDSWRVGNFLVAEQKFIAYFGLANRLAEASPSDPDWLMERGYSESALGTYLLRRKGDLASSERYFILTLSDFQSALAKRNGDKGILREIADVHGWLGDARRLNKECWSALVEREKERNILMDLQQSDKQNAELRFALVGNGLALARVSLCGGHLGNAIEQLKQGKLAAKALFIEDPENADFQREVRIFDLFEVRIWMELAPTSRPKDADIKATLGDCDVEVRKPHNEEVASFCIILRARYEAACGNWAEAQNILLHSNLKKVFVGNILSPRWGLNFHEEAAFVQPLQGKRER